MGHIDETMVQDKTRQQIFDLLDGKSPSHDPQTEAYRLLVVAVCNYWHQAMPFLFQRIDDYTELLMPDDLLSGNSILAYTREAMTPDACENVEVIGWLYQFYISEKKDAVFAALPVRDSFQDLLTSVGSEKLSKVKVVGIIDNPRQPLSKYNPSHPDADDNGFVAMPNINLGEEMVNMMSATRSYEANVTAIKATKDMALKALEIGR